ncbi:MAG: sugar ABC transporter permease [Microbacteriaceae bacterium]|nr:MAG: sugar ABC transporter permease [Microbacteriaceae bacterium]
MTISTRTKENAEVPAVHQPHGIPRKPRRARGAAGYWLIAPLVAFLLALVVAAIVIGVTTSVQAYTIGSQTHPFAGLGNFEAVLGDPGFYHAVGFTLVFTGGSLVGEMILGTALALLFNRVFPGKSVFFTLAMFPILIAPAFMASLWQLSLNSNAGLLGAIFARLGLSQNLLGPSTAVPTLIAIDILHWAPFVMIMIYSGLRTVPAELYESSTLDGAGYWKSHFYVVFPYIMPVIAVTLFLRLIDGLKTFDTIYILTGGGPGTETTNINIYAYKLAFTNGNFGQSSATSLIFLIVLLILVPAVTRYILPKQTERKKVKTR